MNVLLIHMVKAALYITALYLVYAVFLSKDTYYNRNRTFVILSLLVSLLFPLITFQTIKPLTIQFFGKLLSEVFITPGQTTEVSATQQFQGYIHTVCIIYVAGVTALLVRLLFDVLSLLYVISRKKSIGSRIIRFNGFDTAGFSAMGHIFISNRLSLQEADEIVRHEMNHLKKNHFIDIVFMELVKAFQWFNPAVYLFDRSLRAIHEYQADEECLSSGVPVSHYQSLLLNQIFGSRALNLTNSFSNPSLVRKRLLMMTKKRTSPISGMKLLIAIPAIGLVFIVISSFRNSSGKPESNKDIQTVSQTIKADGTAEVAPPPPPPPPPEQADGKQLSMEDSNPLAPYVKVDEMPVFPGGDTELLKFISQHTNYPEKAKVAGIQGKVVVRFCVTETGTINLISVLKGVDPELDAEAARVVQILPAFIPGKKDGKPVPVWYMVPITFALK